LLPTGPVPRRPIELPGGVYEANCEYPVQQIALDEKANKELAALCRLLEVDVSQAAIRLGREAVEEATKLGAAHASASGFQSLIVGDDVAAQLASDYLKGRLKIHRALPRRQRDYAR
jgi:hypothetical protein